MKKESVVDGQPKMIVSGRTKYDAFGRVTDAYYPVVSEMTNKEVFDTTYYRLVPPTRTTYDVLDRVLTTTLPDRTRTTMAYDIAEGMLRTTVTDALNHRQETYTDGGGKTLKTVQYHNDTALVTRFHYDAINQLDTVTDAAGKKTISVYDWAGRRTQVTHPASGITRFGYDAAGNLISRQTANMIAENKGKAIRYHYTYNRLDSVQYPDHPENNVRYTYGSSTETGPANHYRAGRLKYMEDGSGAQEYKYGRQGEVTELKRTLVIPNQAVATYTTKTAYDSWNRLLSMTYPDGEQVNYTYNTGGLLTGVASTSNVYVADVKYDKFEQRTYLKYGNDAETFYTYNDSNRVLSSLSVKSSKLAGTPVIMNNAYTYDAVKNITKVENKGTAQATNATLSGSIGGSMEHNYRYDDLYRLQSANGVFNSGQSRTATYTLAMGYDNMHNITRKTQHIEQTGIQFAGKLSAGYDLSYSINADNCQQISNIADQSYRYEGTNTQVPEYKVSQYSYDANGNLLSVNTGKRLTDSTLQATHSRKLLWDEENRMLALSDNGFVSNYWYDAAGERTVKMSGDAAGVAINGVSSAALTGTTNFTAYISPYMVVRNGGEYTKHIYMGSQRITSKVSNSGIFAASPVNTTELQAKFAQQSTRIKERFDSLGVKYSDVQQSGGLISSSPSGAGGSYFYHSDHLGSSSLITDANANITQHVEYVPFGEVFVEERNSNWSTPYLFNGKERDAETGLSYYGARYYDPRTSVWLSVDPVFCDYLNINEYDNIFNSKTLNSYSFSNQNPIGNVDYEGGCVWAVTGGIGAIINTGINVYQQVNEGSFEWKSGKTWARLGVAFGTGFIAGATGNIGVAITANAASSFGDQVISNNYDITKVNLTNIAIAGVMGGAGTKLAGALEKSKVLNGIALNIADRLSPHIVKKGTSYVMGKTSYYISSNGQTPFSSMVKYLTKGLGPTASNILFAPTGLINSPDYLRHIFRNNLMQDEDQRKPIVTFGPLKVEKIEE